ncbi:hypothetical protein [Psychroserpens algicola]|uniref:Prenyltransferase n=1 Tax=Psychroserpens algicola TaxID=1719034 RepID=A0ABT0H6R9_9FLAO|nr:hypothetical protein [Psychroserpens algicola]MCK8480076.1 hypothetical protein [Psychroserpens algicola]
MVHVLKKIFDFYINSSLHVALAVFSLSWLTLLQFGIEYDKHVLFFILFSTITGYNFVKYFGLAKFHHRSLANWLKAIQFFSLLCFVALCYFLFKLETKTILYVAVFGVVTFLYAIPLVPKTIFIDSKKNLRSISGLKIYVIALVWTGVTVLLPLLNNDYAMTNDVVVVALQRFVFVMVLMLPFEIRDLSYDSLKLSTIPQKIGVMRTKILGVVLVLVFLGLEFFKINSAIQLWNAHILISMLTLIFLVFARENQNKYYSGFWVESLSILWLLLVLLFG